MLQTLKNAWKVEELKKGILFTLMILIVYRIGAAIPVPFVDANALQMFFNPTTAEGAEQSATMLFQYFNLLSGDAFSRATLFALSISPYINASILQLPFPHSKDSVSRVKKAERRLLPLQDM